MPERLDRVTIAYSRGVFELPWDSRDQLLEQLRDVDSARGIRDAFVAVGASRPLELKRDDVVLLVKVIEKWMRKARGPSGLPQGIFDLRYALIDDLDDTTSS